MGRLVPIPLPVESAVLSCRLQATAVLAILAACASPSEPLSDGLAPHAPSVPLVTAPDVPDARFPHAPLDAGWVTLGTLTWDRPIPYRKDPVYEGDNGSHLVDFSGDDPGRDWGRQAEVVQDPEAPGGTALECRLPAGLAGGYAASKIGQHPDWRSNGPLRWDPALSTGHLYIGVYVRFSPGFRLNGNVGQKVLYLKSDLPQNRALNHMPAFFLHDDRGGDQLYPTYEPQHPFSRMQVSMEPRNDLNDGRWHLVEMLQTPNTPGRNDGALHLWIDGREAGAWNDARFFDEGQVPSVNRLEINPIFGGGRNPVAQAQWVRVGALRVATR